MEYSLVSYFVSMALEIRYKTLEISEYLLPFNNRLNIEEKRKLFETRNRMTRIPYNFGKKDEKSQTFILWWVHGEATLKGGGV